MMLLPLPVSVQRLSGSLEFNSRSWEECIISQATDASLSPAESYTLSITRDGIRITAADAAGIYRAKTTVRQLALSQLDSLPCVLINDAPRFTHRGFMVDSARHMQSIDELKRIIDAAALFKFNVFHWHLTDDQGLRIELDGMPGITQKGCMRKSSDFNKRDANPNPYGGFYTKAQMRQIVDYCHERYIKVIPELELPGHSTAILHACPELSCTGKPIELKTTAGVFKDIMCAGNDECFNVIFAILDELCEIFTDDMFHIGGDEAPKARWQACPKCNARLKSEGLEDYEQLQGWFVNKVIDYLKGKGKTALVWNESINGGNLNNDAVIQRWMDKTDNSVKAANAGYKTIISSFKPYYADYPYGMYPLNEVYAYEPLKLKGLTDKGRASVTGIETPIWTEHINNFEQLCRLCFPRWLAVAETGWTPPELKEKTGFLQRSAFFCDELKCMGISSTPPGKVNPSVPSRLNNTVKFFGGFLTKDIVLNFLNPKRDTENQA